MKKLILFFLLIITIGGKILYAQDTLPKFSVKNIGNNRIVISWTNTFENIKQISIQRSSDSLTNYKTILTVPDATTPQNGFVDTKADNDRMFYRLYILLDKGAYLFSNAKRPVLDSMRKVEYHKPIEIVMNTDSIKMPADSIKTPTIVTPVKNKPTGFVPSLHVYTSKDGYVRINLPDDENLSVGKPAKKYSIKFFEDNEAFLFELKDIKQKTFRIDKADFYHAGWFRFELYEDGKLIEKHRFYLEKDF
jgi:hypothetical protein